MLVLLDRGICDVLYWDDLRWHDIPIKFHENWPKLSNNIKVWSQKFERLKYSYY